MIIIPPRTGGMMGRAIGSRIMLRDDAGVERALATFESEDAPDLASPVTAGALARLRTAAAARRSGAYRVAAVITILTAMAIAPGGILGTIILVRSMRAPPWVLFAAMFLAVGASVTAMILVLPRISARAAAANADLLADALLRMRRCAACGYPLAADAEPNDGMHICSECGASWGDQRIGPVQAPSAPPNMRNVFRATLGMSAACRSKAHDDAGRLYGEPPRLRHVSMPKLPGDNRLSRGTWLQVATIIVGILGSLLFMIAVLVLGRNALPPWAIITITAASACLVPIIIISSIRRQRRWARHILLRVRRCVACRQRLDRRGDVLHRQTCDATWNRPSRERPPRSR